MATVLAAAGCDFTVAGVSLSKMYALHTQLQNFLPWKKVGIGMPIRIRPRLHHQKGLALNASTVAGLSTSGHGSNNPHDRQSLMMRIGKT